MPEMMATGVAKDKGARCGHHEHRHDRLGSAGQNPRECAHGQREGSKEHGVPISQPANRRLVTLRILNQGDDLLVLTLAAGAQGADL